jgi:hypothetical protein
MGSLSVENFKFGLDTRKSQLTSIPGTLGTAINCHLTQGGEIEKRKKFAQTLLPTNSFGLEVTTSGLVIFGSVATGALSIAVPAGYTYQRLQHPDGSTAMTEIVASRAFSGKAFAVAKFADGNVYCYYDGTLVTDFIAGLILASMNTNTKIGTEFARLVNLSSTYDATDHVNGTVDVLNQPGTEYVTDTTLTTTLGTLTNVETSTGVPATTGIAAQGAFSIQHGSASAGTNKITSVKVNGTECLSASVDWATSNEATAAALAANINAYAPTSGYTATQSSNVVTLYSTTVVGATANGYEVKVTAAGNVLVGNFSFFLALQPGVSSISTKTYVYANLVDITNGGVNWTTDVATTCAAIVTAINAYSGTSGYNAFSSAGSTTVYISKLVTSSLDPAVSMSVTSGVGGVVTYGGPPSLSALITPFELVVTYTWPSPYSSTSGTTGTATIGFVGGVPPYTYSWQSDTPNIIPVSSTSQKSYFITSGAYNSIAEGVGRSDYSIRNAAIVTGTIVDSLGNSAQAQLIINY